MVAMVKNRLVYANKISEVAPKSNAGVSICKVILMVLIEDTNFDKQIGKATFLLKKLLIDLHRTFPIVGLFI
jgi:hypothetical protein